MAQRSGLSFNYVEFPPKKEKHTYIICIHCIYSVYMCVYIYICLYNEYTSYHRTGDYTILGFVHFSLFLIFLQTQPKSEI